VEPYRPGAQLVQDPSPGALYLPTAHCTGVLLVLPGAHTYPWVQLPEHSGEAGTYSAGSAGVCSLCPAGAFGNATGLVSSACSGPCLAGYACPVGSTNATVTLCPPGTYSTGGAGVCTVCSAGTPYSGPGATSVSACVSCAGACTSGTWGAYACPGVTADWAVWLDAQGVEANHSCVK
jgi:hypothetical protein